MTMQHIFHALTDKSMLKIPKKLLFSVSIWWFYCSQHVASGAAFHGKEATLSEGCGMESSFPLLEFPIDNLTSTSHKPWTIKTFFFVCKATENNRRRPFFIFPANAWQWCEGKADFPSNYMSFDSRSVFWMARFSSQCKFNILPPAQEL